MCHDPLLTAKISLIFMMILRGGLRPCGDGWRVEVKADCRQFDILQSVVKHDGLTVTYISCSAGTQRTEELGERSRVVCPRDILHNHIHFHEHLYQ